MWMSSTTLVVQLPPLSEIIPLFPGLRGAPVSKFTMLSSLLAEPGQSKMFAPEKTVPSAGWRDPLA